MPSGGARVGAGRPRGKAAKREPKAVTKAPPPVPSDIKVAAHNCGLEPLDYMLRVMNDPEAEDARRDRMAVAAAPYVHAKPGDAPKGKKEEAEEAAKTAGSGTAWGDDLAGPTANLN